MLRQIHRETNTNVETHKLREERVCERQRLTEVEAEAETDSKVKVTEGQRQGLVTKDLSSDSQKSAKLNR